MLTIKDATIISEEVLREDIFGIIKLYNISDSTKPEASASRILSITYPTQSLCQTLKASFERFNAQRAQGTFIFAGGYGTGKSHSLLAIYHLFKEPNEGQKWLKRWQLDIELPSDAKVIVSHLLDEDPDFLWEPIFEISDIRDFPTVSQIKSALSSEKTVIILDELESWYESIDDQVRRDRNLNFLQNLSEVAADTTSSLLLFASVYGKNQDILARLGREKIFLKDLGASEDKIKVVLFRLFSQVDTAKATQIVESYVKTYSEQIDSLRPIIGPLDEYRSKMLNTFPLHPELVDILFQSYGSSKNYQNTRGILYLLSGVLRKVYSEEGMLLPKDVDPEYDEVHDDLYQLHPELLERCIEDIRRNKDEELSKGILSTILLHSFVPEKAGCDEGEIILGNLKPALNVNEIHRVLRKLEGNAPYLWRLGTKYLIKTEVNLPVDISYRARKSLQESKTEAKEKLGAVIKELLKGSEAYIYPHEEIPDTKQIKAVVSTKYIEAEEIAKSIYFGREWRNTLIFIRPKTIGDLFENQDMLLRAQRILICEGLEKEGQLAKEKMQQLKDIKRREERELESKIQAWYGEWMKSSMRGDKIGFRPLSVTLSSTDVMEKVRDAASEEVLDSAILSELRAGKEKGVKFDELRTTFLKQPGKPILASSNGLRERLRHLCKNEQILLEKGKNIYGQNNVPSDVADDMAAYLLDYAPAPPKKPKIEQPSPETPDIETPEITDVDTSEETPEVTIISEQGKNLVIETLVHTTPFNLQTEVEGKLKANDQVLQLKASIRGNRMEELSKFEELLRKLTSGKANVDLKLDIFFPEGIDKSRLMRILDQLPVPIGGNISASLEVKKDEQ